ncbi:MAG: helix-turn-helix domain-containing protein [Ilumatobacteraceae bacterium]|nr:MAG: TetR/AcrR family transcriptional regulator [Actinomycetota bacterium]
MSAAETPARRVLDAAKRCMERWGVDKVTVDDIATEAGVSRATLYRMFPGGKDVLFESLRVQELEEFFTRLSDHLRGADSFEEIAVRAVVHSTRELRADEHLALMMASEPGTTISSLTVDGLPRIIRVATLFLAPLVDPYLDRREAARFVDLVARLVISYFLAPSGQIDLGDTESAREFLHQVVLPSFAAAVPAAHAS